MADLYVSEQPLTNENIERIVTELTAVYTASIKKRRFSETKFRVALEELLLRFRDCYGAEQPCRVAFARRFGKYTIDLSQVGARRDWLPCDEDIRLSYDILASLGVVPRYVYSRGKNGRNRVLWEALTEEKKRSMLWPMLGAIALAVLAGILINRLPADVHRMLSEDLITPLFSKLTAILSALATPLVFFAVINGIIGIGDVKSFGRIGSSLLSRMAITYGIAAVFLGIGGVIAYGVLPQASSAAEGTSAVGQVVRLVLDIIPSNLFVPFGQDNDLQVIVIAVFVGVTMLILGQKVARLNDLVREGSELINKMMLLCCKLLPAVVFFGVANLIVTSNAEQLSSIWKMLLVYLLINLCFITSLVIRTCIVTRTSFLTIFPKQLATLLINITTASQVAALPENMKCCKEKFGIDPKTVDFGLPLGIVIYMPSGSIFLGLTAWALCALTGVPITIGLMVRILLMGTIIAIAAPPIPGSALVVMPILFTACGIPTEAFPLAIIFGTIVGYIVPTFNGFNIQLELLMTAKRLGKVDLSVLRDRSKK